MECLWLVYWGILLLSLIFGIVVLVKKKSILGIFQSILSLILPIWTLIFSLNRDYLVKKESEIEFLYKNVISGNIEAILITLLYLILIIVLFYNVVTFKKKN